MTVKAWTNNSYHGGSDAGIAANSLSLSTNVFINKAADIITKAVAAGVISGVNYSVGTFASDNESVGLKEIEFAPADLGRRYIVDVIGQTIIFDADLVTSNVVDLDVNGVAMTSETFVDTNANLLTAIAAQIVTDFDEVVAAASDGTHTITVYPTAGLNGTVVITDVLVTLGSGQAVATVAPLTIANTDEGKFYDIYRDDVIDWATAHSTSGQVKLVRAIWASKWEFTIANT